MAEAAKTNSPKPSSPSAPVVSESPAGPAGPAPVILEADPEPYGDGDSAIGSAAAGSDTTSLASSVLKFRMENGRRYHAYKAGAYFLPNDETENERLDLQHNLCILMQGNQLFLCPAVKEKPPKRVLDAGCGTGIWTIDFADEYPETQIVGVDLSPIQPSFVPPNVEFLVDDLEADWTFSTPFDFIYMRMLTGSIMDWQKLFRQAYQNLAPGGYIEVSDPINPITCDDGTLPEDSAMARWNKLLNDAANKLGAGLDSARKYKQQLIDAGFTNVVQTEYKWPMNPWPKDRKYKELGAWVHENISQGLQALSLVLFTRVLGWQPEELEVFLVDVRKDMKNRQMHGYWPYYTIYAQKPE